MLITFFNYNHIFLCAYSVKGIINLVTVKVNIFTIFIFLVSKMFSFEQKLISTAYAIKLLYLDVSIL